MIVKTLCVIGLLISITAGALGDDWPQWRGPRLDSRSLESGLPVQWSKTENVFWRLPLPGPAGASPIVVGDNVFVTSPDGEDIVLLCVSTEGQERWRQTFGSENKTYREDEGNSASPSPCSDGQFVWAADGNGNLACYTVAGESVWKKNLQDDYGEYKIQFGMASTPVLHEGKLYLQLIHGSMRDQASSEAWVVCLDGASGREIWKHLRKTPGTSENKHSYASPTIYLDGANSFLLVHGADYITAHALADGSELWRCGGLNPTEHYNPFLRFVASPTCGPGLIVVPSAKNGPVLGLKPGFSGDITDNPDALQWKMDTQTPDVPTPVIDEGLVYLCRENGVVICVDAQTGEKQYEERVQPDRYRASPIVAGGHVYVTSRRGLTTVLKTGRSAEIVSKNNLEEPVTASPAVANGRIYLRSFDALYCIGSPESSASGSR